MTDCRPPDKIPLERIRIPPLYAAEKADNLLRNRTYLSPGYPMETEGKRLEETMGQTMRCWKCGRDIINFHDIAERQRTRTQLWILIEKKHPS